MRVSLVALLLLTSSALLVDRISAEDSSGDHRCDLRLGRAASAQALRRALDERVLFDSIVVTLPTEEPVIELNGLTSRLTADDLIVTHVHALDERIARQEYYANLSDNELLKTWIDADPIPPLDYYGIELSRHAALNEIARRGGATWSSRICARLRALLRWRSERDHATGYHGRDLEHRLVLDRLAQDPDSLLLTTPANIKTSYPTLPRVNVSLLNHGTEPVTLTRWGSDRGERMDCVHFEVRTVHGRLMPGRLDPTGGSGGLTARQALAPTQEIDLQVPLSRYVLVLPPGRYRARLHYSDFADIAGPDGFLDSVTVRSDWFDIEVAERSIATSEKLQSELYQMAEALPTAGPVQILSGCTYGPWAHAKIDPNSAAGKLLARGWEAVPCLIRVSNDERFEIQQRGWALSLLYAISDTLPPHLALGDYDEHQRAPFAPTPHGVVTRRVRGRWYNSAVQELAAEWRSIGARIRVVMR